MLLNEQNLRKYLSLNKCQHKLFNFKLDSKIDQKFMKTDS